MVKKTVKSKNPIHISLDNSYDCKELCYRDKNVVSTILEREFKNRWHIHHFFEIEMLLEGSAEIEIDGTEFIANKGCCWFCMPGTTHTVNNLKNPKLLSIKFDECTVDQSLNKYIASNNVFFVSNFSQSELDKIYETFLLATTTAKRCEDVSSLVIKGFLQFLIALIIDKSGGFDNQAKGNEMKPTVLNVIVYTKLHIEEPITLKQIAGKFGYTPNYLSKLFKQEIGKSYSGFLTEERLRIANTMLKKSDLSISEISKQVGFTSSAYFCRVYKRYFGKTPTQFKTV